jgi:hypothetical protein
MLPEVRPPEKPARSGAVRREPANCDKRGLESGTPLLQHGDVAQTKPARCEDCYFHQNQLCALNLGKPCTTFRPAERGLAPERQLAFVFRSERTTAAYAFPQPHA